ncbi:hypothetical protein MLD38_039643 [Melastoma candidum]|nr:hypothetical protein MLD38_039643 [Melastoma candidum]
MAGNDITVEAAPHLSACIASKQHLTKLNLSENELKDEGAILIAKALEEGQSHLEEVDFSSNLIRRAGARTLAQAVAKKPGFKLLNINGNFISEDGIDDVKEIFKKCPEVLASLEDNDPEGGDGEESGEEEGEGENGELESKLKNLEVGK